MSFALPDALFFTGIDWAAETHAVCVLDAAGKIVAEFAVEHSADGIAVLLRRLARLGDPGGLPVAIERPDGRLVDLLLEAGHPVVPVKPNAIKTWREGEVLSGAKSDAGDAAVIAEYLRLRQHKLPPLPTPMRPGHCALSCAPAMTWWRCGSRPLTSCRRCWRRTGPVPGPFSLTPGRRSAWSSSPVTRPPHRPAISVRSAWPRSAPSTATPAAAPPCSSWRASTTPRPARPLRISPKPSAMPSWQRPAC